MTPAGGAAGRLRVFVACVGVAALALLPAEVQAVGIRGEDRDETIEITIHPAAEPRPALRYRLLPADEGLADRNAAILYLQAQGFLGQYASRKRIDELLLKAQEDQKRAGKSFKWPPGVDSRAAALPLTEVREFLALHDFQVPLLEEAARRRHCDWDRPLANAADPLGLSPFLNYEVRNLARVESLRCRLAIAEGRVDDALTVLRRQFMLARHLGQDDYMANGCIGPMAVSRAARDALELVQLPDAPNLYWACEALPRPVIDPSHMLAEDQAMLYLVMKSLRDVDETPRPAEYWHAVIDRDLRSLASAIRATGNPLPFSSGDWGYGFYYHHNLHNTLTSSLEPAEISRLRAAAFVAAAFPGARRYLAEECGLPAERLEALPSAQVVFLAMRRFYDASNDELAKWEAAPYWIAAAKLKAVRKKIEADAKRIGPAATPAAEWIPHLTGFRSLFAGIDQQIASLQTVEALRLHAAIRGGLPESLAELPVPAPLDPATGQPIAYSVAGNRAVLEPGTIEGQRLRIIVHLAPPTRAPAR